ncbi:tetratricopeptide repeat protein, partial [bacterium]|nr:tetratricopeptide repeat protein [candidate division CSSED10-310 bacterium]
AEARIPHSGEALGAVTGSYQPSAYAVSAKVLGRKGLRPRIWDPARGGLVPAPEQSYAVDEEIGLKAVLDGTPRPDPLRWQWLVNDGTSLRSSGISDTASVSRHETGMVTAVVTARDGDGRLLGTDTVSLSVSIDAEQMKIPPEPPIPRITCGHTLVDPEETVELAADVDGGKKPYRLIWKGAEATPRGAVFSSEFPGIHKVELHVIDAAGTQAMAAIDLTVREVNEEMETHKALDALLKDGYALEQAGDLPGALAKYKEALALSGDARVAEHIAELEAAIRGQGETKALIEQGYDLERRGDLAGACAKYEQSLAIEDNPRVRERTDQLRDRIKEQARATLVNEGDALALQEKYEEAIGTYQQALNMRVDETVTAKLAVVEANRDRAVAAGRLLEEGYQLERGGDLTGAVGKYEEAQHLKPDPKVAARLGDLKGRMRDKGDSDALLREGYAHEQKKEWQAALDCYSRAQRGEANPKVEERIRLVRARLEEERAAADKARHEAERAEATRREAARMETARREATRTAAAKARAEQTRSAPRHYDLNGQYRMSKDGETVILAVTQNGTRVRITVRMAGATQALSESGGQIKGDNIVLDHGAEIAIRDDGRTLEMSTPDGIMRFKR